MGTDSGGHSSRHIGFASLALFTCPEMSLEQPRGPHVPQGYSRGSHLGAGNGVVSQNNMRAAPTAAENILVPGMRNLVARRLHAIGCFIFSWPFCAVGRGPSDVLVWNI